VIFSLALSPVVLAPDFVFCPAHTEFLKSWLRVLVRPVSGTLTVRQQADLDTALRGTLALELSASRLSRLAEFLDSTDAEGLYARLSPWCEAIIAPPPSKGNLTARCACARYVTTVHRL